MFCPHQLLHILWRVFSPYHPCSCLLATGESPGCQAASEGCHQVSLMGHPRCAIVLLLQHYSTIASQAVDNVLQMFKRRPTENLPHVAFTGHRSVFFFFKLCLCFRSKLKFAQGIPSDSIAFVNAFKVTCLMPSEEGLVSCCIIVCPYLPDGYLSSTVRHGT